MPTRTALMLDGTRRDLTPAEIAEMDALYAAGSYVTDERINAERDRRLLEGRSFTVTGYGVSIRLAGDDMTRANLKDFADAAYRESPATRASVSVEWRDEDDVIHTLTLDQVIELYELGRAYYQGVIQAAWPLKDTTTPRITDETDDGHWPART